MSRNKFILLFGMILILYFLLPSKGLGMVIRANMMAVAPYILLFVIFYLLITINLLKRSLKRMDLELCDETVINVVKMMNITFDVKRMMGTDNLQTLYNQVNASRRISIHTKTMLYEALRKKRMDVAPPSAGKAEHVRNSEEVKSERIGSKKRNKKKRK